MLGSQIGEGELSNPVITQTVAREPGLPGTYHLRACGCQELEPSKGQGPQGQPCSTAPAQPARPGPLLREDPCPRPPHPLPGRETPTCALPPQVPWQWAPGALCVCTGEIARESMHSSSGGPRGPDSHWNKLLPGAQADWGSARTSE